MTLDSSYNVERRGFSGNTTLSFFVFFKCVIALLFLFVAQTASADTVILKVASSSPWTVPANVYSITVECWGAGGGGSGDGNGNGTGISGAGGGAYARTTIGVTPSQTLPFSVGVGGAGGVNGGGGALGGNTSFNTNTCIAEGGLSSTLGGGRASFSTGDVKYSGGSGYFISGGTAYGGGGGAAADSDGTGVTASGQAGATANTDGGDGGDGGAAGGNGLDGTFPGGGGGGSGDRSGGAESGGSGADGMIRITYTTGLPITGTLYSNEGSSAITTSKNIKMYVGSSTPGIFSTTTVSGTGVFNFDIEPTAITAGDPIIVWVDGETQKAVTVTRSAGGILDFDLYQNTVIMRDESGSGLTLSDLEYDSTDDADILYTTGASSLEILNGAELHIWSGDTFQNAASSTLSGGFHNDGGVFDDNGGVMKLTGSSKTMSGTMTGTSELGSLSIYGSYTMNDNASTSDVSIQSGGSLAAPNSLTIVGDYTNIGTYTAGTNLYLSTTTTQTLSGSLVGTSALGGVNILGSGTTTFSASASTTNLTISGGTLVAPAANLTIEGIYTNNGNFDNNSGVVYFDGGSSMSGNLEGTSGFNDFNILSGGLTWSSSTVENYDNTDEDSRAIVSDDNYIYVAGVRETSASVYGYYTVAINKETGENAWATTTDPGANSDYATAITLDDSNVYVTGYCNSCGGVGGNAYYTVAIDKTNGDFVWSTTTDIVAGTDRANAITVDDSNVYVTGYCDGCGTQNYAYYTVAIDKTNGDFVWSTTTDPGGTFDQPYDITNDASYVYVAGTCSACGVASDTYLYTVAMDKTNGNFVWASSTYPHVYDNVTPAGMEMDDNNLYISASCFGGSATVCKSELRLYTVAIDKTNGDLVWSTTTNPTPGNFLDDTSEGLTSDSQNLYIVARAEVNISPIYDVYLMAVDKTNGDFVWGDLYGIKNDDPQDITSDGVNLYVTDLCSSCDSFGSSIYVKPFNKKDGGAARGFMSINSTTTSSGTFTINAGAAVKFPANATSTFNNVYWQGGGGSEILLRSTSAGTQWYLDIQGTDTIEYVDVQDSNASSSSGGEIIAPNSIDSGNNSNWSFITDAVINFLGTIYSDEGATPITAGRTIKIAVGTTTTSVHSTTTDTGAGTFTISVDDTNVSANDPIVVWIDNATEDAVTVSKINSFIGDITGLNLYQDTVIVRDDSDTSLTLADMAIQDSTDDTDIIYTASTGSDELEILNGAELHIWSGDTFVNAASSTLSGGLHNAGTFDDNAGVMKLAGTGQAASGTLTGTSELGVVQVYGSYDFADNASTTDLTIQSGGALTAPALLSVSGNYTNNGTFSDNNGTVYLSGTSKTLNGTLTGASGFNNLVVSGSRTFNSNASTSNLTINSSTNFYAPAILTISGDYNNNGTFNDSSGEVIFNGVGIQSATGNMTSFSAFYDLTINNNTATTTFESDFEVDNEFTATLGNTIIEIAGNSTGTIATATITGTNGNEIRLWSDTGGTQYTFLIENAYTIQYVDVKDSYACDSVGGEISAIGLVDSGNNNCWTLNNTVLLDAYPSAKSGTDDTTENITEIQSNDSAVDPDTLSAVTASDGAYTIDKGAIMYFSAFDFSSIPAGSTISSADLVYEYGVEDGFTGTNDVRYNTGGGLTNTGFAPTDVTGFVQGSIDLYSLGVDTLSELQALEIEYTSNDGGGADAVHFDYMYVSVAYTPPAEAGPTSVVLYGTLYSDEGSTQITSGKTIKLAIGTTTVSTQSTTTDSGAGTFSFSFDNTNGYATDTPMIIFVDADGTTRAALVTKATSSNSNVSGLDLYQNRVIIRQEGSTSTGLTDLAKYDSTDDADLQYTTSGTELTILNGQELHIWSGDTFVNAASSTLTGGFHNAGVFDDNGGVMKLTGTGEAASGTLSGTSELGAVQIYGSYDFANNASTSDLTIQSGGSLTAPTLLTITGDYTNNGTYTAGTNLYLSTTTSQSLSGNLVNTSALGNVTVLGGGTSVFSAAASTTDLTVVSGSALTAPTILTVAGDFTNNGTFDDNGGELYFSGTDKSISGTLVNTNDLGNITFTGSSTFANNASTTNFTIGTNATVTAPTVLSIAGNYTNDGTFYNNSGNVYFSGVSVQTATGTMTGASQFYDLTIINTSGTGATQSITFGSPVSATGTFTMIASTSAEFLASATSTFKNVDWQGNSTGTDPVWLRSTSDGTQWNLDIQGSATIEFVDVKDSNASSSYGGEVTAATSTDSGNNSNWAFPYNAGESPAVTGSTTIADHDATQVNNAFSFQNKTNEPFYAFKLIPESGNATVTNLSIELSGAKKLNSSAFSNWRLYKDHDNDALYDASDEQVGGAGVMTLNGDYGSLVFSTEFLSTTTTNYLVVGNWSAPDNGSAIKVDLLRIGVSATDDNGSQTIYGNVDHAYHSRNNAGGGGRVAIIGTDNVTPLATTTGGTNEGGELIGTDPDYKNPTNSAGDWTNHANIIDQTDGTYGSTNTNGASSTLSNHGFTINAGNTIEGVEVKLEISGTTAAGDIDVQLSWDSGTSWTSTKNTGTLTTTDTVVSLGGPADTWGRTWTIADFSNANFRVRVIGNVSSNTVQIDALQVRVYHQAGGGGAGGGGAI